MTDKAHDVSVTGCLSKGADGKFTLTNARVDNPAGTSTTTGTTGTTSTSTPGTNTTTGTTAANAAAMSWALMGGTDLDKHVGHKIQITGKTVWDSAMDHSRTPDSTSAAAGTTPPPAAGTAAGTTGTSGTTTTATAEAMRKEMGDQPRLDVQSVKMIAPSCS